MRVKPWNAFTKRATLTNARSQSRHRTGPDKIKTCGQMVREQRLAGEILGRMLIVGVDSMSAYARPVAGSKVIPPKPHEGHKIDLFVVRKVRDERGQLFLHRIIRLILKDPRILVVSWIGARVRLGHCFLRIELTRLHDDETHRLQRNRQLRRSWFLGGLALIAAANWFEQDARVATGLFVGGLYLFAALGNFWATRGLHPGWMLMAVALILIIFGVSKSGG
jgi:hypothetical protein